VTVVPHPVPRSRLYLQEVALRDRMHAIRHRIPDRRRSDRGRRGRRRVDAVEVAHGGGLAGGSVTYG
jgi:4-hydroxy 2-oxovalerate aldolase